MRQISSLLQGLARSLSVGRDRDRDRKGNGAGDGKTAVPAVLRTSGTLWGDGSDTFAAVCSRRGEKGINQDCSIVWEVSSLFLLLGLCCSFCFFLPLISFGFLYWTSGVIIKFVIARDISTEFFFFKKKLEISRRAHAFYCIYKKPNMKQRQISVSAHFVILTTHGKGPPFF